MTNSETFVTWKAYWTGGVASVTVLITICIALMTAHAWRPHKDAVTQESLTEHVSVAREERKEIIASIDHVEESVHKIELEQAKMIQTLDLVYEEVLGLD